jgi:hypothetical protein
MLLAAFFYGLLVLSWVIVLAGRFAYIAQHPTSTSSDPCPDNAVAAVIFSHTTSHHLRTTCPWATLVQQPCFWLASSLVS